MKSGTLYGISVGTGDPELITVKGLRLIQQVPIVAFPAGMNSQPGIAEQIITRWLTSRQQTLALDFPYTSNQELLAVAWEKAATNVWQYLKQGNDVAFACLGDISFYSTFNYLAQTLQALYPDVKIETVPGICSPMAVASILGKPLTINEQSLVILPAIYALERLESVLDWADVLVLLKVNSVYQQVWKILSHRGLLGSSFVVEKASFPEQKIYRDLTTCPQLKLAYFSLLITYNCPNNSSY